MQNMFEPGWAKLITMLAMLTPKEEDVIRKRFGVGEKYPYTLKQVGKAYGVTSGRIWQIQVRALRKLRHPRIREF